MRALLALALVAVALGAAWLVARWQEPTPPTLVTPINPTPGEPWWHYATEAAGVASGGALLGPAGGNLAYSGLRAAGV